MDISNKTIDQHIIRVMMEGKPLFVREIARIVSKKLKQDIRHKTCFARVNHFRASNLRHFIHRVKMTGCPYAYFLVNEARMLTLTQAYGLTRNKDMDAFPLEKVLCLYPELAKYVENAEILTAPKPDPFFIVGIGAYEGGMEAIEKFFSHMPKTSGLAFIVGCLMKPDQIGILMGLLNKCTRMKVILIEEGAILQRNRVYLIPPGQAVDIRGNTLHLAASKPADGVSSPGDQPVRSQDNDSRDQSVAIILSGMQSHFFK